MRIKVCGITSLYDAELAITYGAWALGFNFYPPSPRYIDPHQASAIIAKIATRVRCVGIFVNSRIMEIDRICSYTGIEYVQLHGAEHPKEFKNYPAKLIKAIPIRDDNDMAALQDWSFCHAILLDAYDEKLYGGTGKLLPLQKVKQAVLDYRIILAGGINQHNIPEVLALNPYGVDICSGTEISHGKKCSEKLQALFAMVGTQDVA